MTASGRVLPPTAPGEWPYTPWGTRPPVSDEPVELTAVPYYAWGNRERGATRVRVRTVGASGHPQPSRE